MMMVKVMMMVVVVMVDDDGEGDDDDGGGDGGDDVVEKRPPHMIVKRFGCTTIHKALYKCFIHSFMVVVKSSQVSFIYTALLTIQIVSKHLTVSSWRIECQ